MGRVALGARTTEPLPRRGKEGTSQMPTSRRGSSGARPFGRLSVGGIEGRGVGAWRWRGALVKGAVAQRSQATARGPPRRRRCGGLGRRGRSNRVRPVAQRLAPALAAASRTSETPQDEPAAPLEHPLHEPPPVPEVAPPFVDAEQPAQAPPVTGRLESPTPAREEPTEPPAGTGPSMRALEPPSRVPTRMGRLVVKAVPYAVVTEGGKPLGEVLGHRVFSLRPGTYKIRAHSPAEAPTPEHHHPRQRGQPRRVQRDRVIRWR